jgi:hypothetical protein
MSSRFLFKRRPGKKTTSWRSRPSVESLEDRTLLSISFSGMGNSGVATLTGTPAADKFVIQLKPSDATTIEFSDDGGTSFTDAKLSGITSIVVNGLAGNDTLTLNEANGLIGQGTALPISYDGGPGHNLLVLSGDAGKGVTESFTAATGSKPAMLTIDNGTVSSDISLTHVGHIFDTVPADSLTLNANDQNNIIHVGGGHTDMGVTTNTVVGLNVRDVDDEPEDDSGMGENSNTSMSEAPHTAIIPFTFANKTSVTVNGLGGDDLFVVSVAHAATGLKNLTLDGGTGVNILVGRQLPAGVTVTLKNINRTDGDTNAAFIDEMFEKRLERPATDQDLAAFEMALMTPGGRAAVVQTIEDSLEARAVFVRHLYERFLGRQAQNGEAMGWALALFNGESEEKVLAAFLSSDEFYNHAQQMVATGTADQRYVTALYEFVLNRQPTSAELSSWVTALPTLGRAGVATAFVDSIEFREGVVAAFYVNLLSRPADLAGLIAWASSNLDLQQIREAFLASDEAFMNG